MMASADELERLAREHGWEVVHGTRSTAFKRPGGGYLYVRWSRSLAVLRVRVGAVGGYDMTGPGKTARLRELIVREA